MDPPEALGFQEADRSWSVDTVIVGAGPGGSAVARVLAGRGERVLIVEEGPAASRFAPNQARAMRFHMQEGSPMVATVGTGEGFLPIAAGRGLGGGTLINSAIAWRAPAAVLDGWAQALQTEALGSAAMTAAYEEMEEYLGVLETSTVISGRNNDLIVRGVQKLGLEGGYLRRYTPHCVGCGICYFGCPSNGKSSTNLNMLPEAVADGAVIQAEAKVEAVRVEGRRAVGITARMYHPETRVAGGTVTVDAKRVVLAAGAVGTPRLLHRCGLAEALGPAVGVGLHVHPGNAVLGVCEEDILMWRGATQGAWFHHPGDSGILPHTMSAPPEVLITTLSSVGVDARAALALLPKITGLVVMVSDKGSGQVGATSDGRAAINYAFDTHDIARIKEGMVWSARVLQAGGAGRVFAPVFGVGMCDTPEQLEARLADRTMRDFTLYASHPMSTCRMGTDPATSVVRPDGRTHAIEGLYIADGSIFPTSLGVNPSLTIFALTTQLARGWSA